MMASPASYKLVPLAEHPNLVDQCVELLNEEWPRSVTYRRFSVEKCMNMRPPMGLILIERENGSIVGHARLCPLLPLQSTDAKCWVESVVVRKSSRRKGIGRLLMETLEEFASQSFGISELVLSTTDQEEFYKKCGYSQCARIVNIGSNSKLFSSPRLEKLLDAAVCSTPFKLEPDREENPSKAHQILPLKPPPTAPPPPPQTNTIKIRSHVPQVFMSKMLLK